MSTNCTCRMRLAENENSKLFVKHQRSELVRVIVCDGPRCPLQLAGAVSQATRGGAPRATSPRLSRWGARLGSARKGQGPRWGPSPPGEPRLPAVGRTLRIRPLRTRPGVQLLSRPGDPGSPSPHRSGRVSRPPNSPGGTSGPKLKCGRSTCSPSGVCCPPHFPPDRPRMAWRVFSGVLASLARAGGWGLPCRGGEGPTRWLFPGWRESETLLQAEGSEADGGRTAGHTCAQQHTAHRHLPPNQPSNRPSSPLFLAALRLEAHFGDRSERSHRSRTSPHSLRRLAGSPGVPGPGSGT